MWSSRLSVSEPTSRVKRHGPLVVIGHLDDWSDRRHVLKAVAGSCPFRLVEFSPRGYNSGVVSVFGPSAGDLAFPTTVDILVDVGDGEDLDAMRPECPT